MTESIPAAQGRLPQPNPHPPAVPARTHRSHPPRNTPLRRRLPLVVSSAKNKHSILPSSATPRNNVESNLMIPDASRARGPLAGIPVFNDLAFGQISRGKDRGAKLVLLKSALLHRLDEADQLLDLIHCDSRVAVFSKILLARLEIGLVL